jgi:hypothetical protein
MKVPWRSALLWITLSATPAYAGECGFDWRARFDRASFVPSVRVGVLASEGLAQRSIEAFAWLAWPLGRQPPRGLLERRASRASEAAARARKLEALRAAPVPSELRDAIDASLDLEEAEAELDALAPEGCP